MECPNCGLINPDTAERCDCGYSFKAQKQKMPVTDVDDNPPPTYCINCGTKVKVIAQFCHGCGSPVYRGTSSEIPPSSPSQPFPPTVPDVLDWYFAPWKKCAVFAGRARRKEYWVFSLGNWIIAIGLGLIDLALIDAGIATATDESVLYLLFSFAVMMPTLAVGVRRMHDTDHSGWWFIVPIANVVFLCMKGTRGANRFGADPK